ncbi:hypothetical protein RND81_09G191500 [Saponaria officinalis]|uniref:Uncharacterized protein n=1 Tax=Saponaria officinalis TaxID=3572 RepID=A0AAW1IP34_SAPOF
MTFSEEIEYEIGPTYFPSGEISTRLGETGAIRRNLTRHRQNQAIGRNVCTVSGEFIIRRATIPPDRALSTGETLLGRATLPDIRPTTCDEFLLFCPSINTHFAPFSSFFFNFSRVKKISVFLGKLVIIK